MMRFASLTQPVSSALPDESAATAAVRDPARLAALRATALLDTETEEVFDRLTRLAVRLIGVPAAFISLVDEQRDFFKSACGVPEPVATTRVVTGPTFCHHAIRSPSPLVIDDTAGDPTYQSIPSVQTFGVAAYVGVPLMVGGQAVGSFCVIDNTPRAWTAAEVEVLTELAASAQREVELRLALRRAEHANELAAAASRAKDDFLALVSHELRSPLAGIASNAQMLTMGLCGPLTDRQARALERIVLCQDHLLGLITQLLDFKTIAAGRIDYDIAPLPVDGVLSSAASIVESQLHEHDVRLELEPATSPVVVLADADKLRQILVNLLANAAKFTPAGGTVTLGCETHGRVARIHVSDTGIGIPDDQLSAVFEPFVQVKDPRSPSTGGTGLGLAISRELARGMGGDIEVESGVGRGSRFTVVLEGAER
jgi:signal transduction histidine kinase